MYGGDGGGVVPVAAGSAASDRRTPPPPRKPSTSGISLRTLIPSRSAPWAGGCEALSVLVDPPEEDVLLLPEKTFRIENVARLRSLLAKTRAPDAMSKSWSCVAAAAGASRAFTPMESRNPEALGSRGEPAGAGESAAGSLKSCWRAVWRSVVARSRIEAMPSSASSPKNCPSTPVAVIVGSAAAMTRSPPPPSKPAAIGTS